MATMVAVAVYRRAILMWSVHIDLHGMMWSWWRSSRSSIMGIQCLVKPAKHGSGAPKEHRQIRHLTLQVLASLLEDIVVAGNARARCQG